LGKIKEQNILGNLDSSKENMRNRKTALSELRMTLHWRSLQFGSDLIGHVVEPSEGTWQVN